MSSDEVLGRTGLFDVLCIVRKRRLGRQTSKRLTGKSDPSNLHQDEKRRAAFATVETCQRSTIYNLVAPDLPRHKCHSDRDPAANLGQTVLANDRNGVRFRLNASRRMVMMAMKCPKLY